MIALTLYLQRDGEDINLGTGFHHVVPPVGALLTFVCNEGVGWRVTQHQYHLITEGSMAHRQWFERGEHSDPPHVDLFVEPSEGPFEP